MTTSTTTRDLSIEHVEPLATLAKLRGFLRHPVDGITDDQARQRPTASGLCLGGLVKHVAAMEAGWIRFVVEGTSAMAFEMTPESFEERAAEFELLPDETLEGVLAHYDDVAARTVAVIAAEPDLSASHPLPDAPWFRSEEHTSELQSLMR